MIRHYSLAIAALMVVGIATAINAQQRPAATSSCSPAYPDTSSRAHYAACDRRFANEQDGGDLHGCVSGSENGHREVQ